MPQYIVTGRFVFSGTALIEAHNIADAKKAFDEGKFEFDASNASCIDWERYHIEADD